MSKSSSIALDTGGSRGLGRSIVMALAERGVSSILTCNSNRSAASEVVGLAEQAGARATVLRLDTGDTAAFAGFVAGVRGVLDGWGARHIDFLVNNAGAFHHAGLAEVTEADFDALYHVHLKGMFFLTQALLPVLVDGGRITVNVVAPGAIQADFSGGRVHDNPEVNRLVAGMTALGCPGLPDDIGPMIASLLSK